MDVFGNSFNSTQIRNDRCILIPGLTQQDSVDDESVPAYIRYMPSSFPTKNITVPEEMIGLVNVKAASFTTKTNKCTVKAHSSNKFGSSVLVPLETARVKRKLNQNYILSQSDALVATYTQNDDDEKEYLQKRRILKEKIDDASTSLSVVAINK
jgi:hypothetical protein